MVKLPILKREGMHFLPFKASNSVKLLKKGFVVLFRDNKMRDKKVFFKTFGCRTNIFDTQVMISNLKDFSVTENLETADYIVINSCTVTNSADTNSRQFLNRVKREFPEKEVLFTGCGVQTQGDKFFKQGLIKSGFGHSEKARVQEFLKSKDRIFKVGDLESLDETLVSEFVGKSRAFIKIQEGCNFKCSYCIIPSVRGKSRSYDISQIVSQVEKLSSNGFGEFTLTGTNIGSYGEGKSSLAKLLKAISQVRGVRRIRLGSIEPSQITDEFKELLSEDWLGRHLHVAIQHSDNRMLKIMNRRNRAETDLELLLFLAEKGFSLGTDYIVGHPGESDEIFKDGFENLKRYPLTHLHLFKYSQRDGTPSSKMGLINSKIVKDRFSLVENLIKEKKEIFRDKTSSLLKVLIEKRVDKTSLFRGYDQFFNTVFIESSEDLEGDWIETKDYNWRKYKDYEERI